MLRIPQGTNAYKPGAFTSIEEIGESAEKSKLRKLLTIKAENEISRGETKYFAH